MLTDQDEQQARKMFHLIQAATSQAVVKDFLRGHDVPISAANWDELYSRRIHPALVEGLLTLAQLHDLLREVEESGRQHIFWFKCPPARAVEMLDERRVRRVLAEIGLPDLLERPTVPELPDSPVISEVRFIPESADEPRSLIVKLVETRDTRKYLGETYDSSTKILAKQWVVDRKRAVSTARLFEDGLFELRIASQDNTTRYTANVNALRRAVNAFFPPDEFKVVLLSTAKQKLWDGRAELAGVVRYGRTEAANDFGYGLSVNTLSSDLNISEDGGSQGAMNAFLGSSGRVVGSNIYFLIPNSDPAREIHILLSGESNEFAVPVACSSEDLNYVRRQIQALNT